MPIFNFQCSSCGREFEELVQSYSTSVTECQFCGSLADKKYKAYPVGTITSQEQARNMPPSRAWDTIIGNEAELARKAQQQQRSEKAKILKDGKVPFTIRGSHDNSDGTFPSVFPKDQWQHARRTSERLARDALNKK